MSSGHRGCQTAPLGSECFVSRYDIRDTKAPAIEKEKETKEF